MRFLSTLIASILGTLVALGLVVFIGFLFIVAIAASSSDQPVVRSGSVLEMTLSGSIAEQVSGDPLTQALMDEPAYDLYDLQQALRMAAVDDRVEAVWLKLHNVAAPWASLQEIRTALLDYKKTGKPLYASGGEYALSEAEYYLATTADSIFADPQAFFEFNGFDLSVAFFDGALEKLNIEPQIVRAGTFKSAVEPFFRDDLSPENEEQLMALLQTQDRLFMEAVADRRGGSPEQWQTLASENAVITAEQGLAAGLLDGLRYDDEVRAVIKARLGLDVEDELDTIDLEDYVRVPPSEAGLEIDGDAEIAVVYAVGTIMTGESTDGTVGSKTFSQAMQQAREDDDISAVVLRVNSPGGSAVAADAMWREIKLTADLKPIVVSMGDYAASGGYWIATAADGPIIADPLTLTGSIGVFSLFFDASGFFNDKLGITFDGVSTSPYADMFSGLETLSDQERALLQQTTDETYRAFLQRVADSRPLTVDEVDAIAQGRVWSGQQALDVGLVDALGGLDEAIARAADTAGLEKGTYRVRTLPRPKTFAEELDDLFSAQARATWLRFGATPTERALARTAELVDELAQMHGTVQARMPLEISVR